MNYNLIRGADVVDISDMSDHDLISCFSGLYNIRVMLDTVAYHYNFKKTFFGI